MVWSNLGSDDGWLLTTANSYSRDHTSLTETLSIKKTADTLLLCHKIHVLQTHIFRSLQNKTDVSKVNAYICREIRCHGFVICVCIRSDIAHDTLGITDRLSQRQPRSSGAVAMTACCYENRQCLYCNPSVQVSADTIVDLCSLKTRSQLAYWWKSSTWKTKTSHATRKLIEMQIYAALKRGRH